MIRVHQLKHVVTARQHRAQGIPTRVRADSATRARSRHRHRDTSGASPLQLAMHQTAPSASARARGSRHDLQPRWLLLVVYALLSHAAASRACAVFRLGPSGFVAQSILLLRLWPLLSANGTVYIDSSIFNYRCSDGGRGGWHEFFETAPLVTWTEHLTGETRDCPHLNGMAAVNTIIGSRMPPQLLLAEGVSQARPWPGGGCLCWPRVCSLCACHRT